MNHDPENPNPELRCLCWPCHRRYDVATGANHPGKNQRRAATRKKNREKRKAKRIVKERRAPKVRVRYLTMLWLVHYLPYLHKRLALERELTTVYLVDGRTVRYMSGPPRK